MVSSVERLEDELLGIESVDLDVSVFYLSISFLSIQTFLIHGIIFIYGVCLAQ